MNKRFYVATALSLLLALPAAPVFARSERGEVERPIRLYATAYAGPIGTLEALGSYTVNERKAYGRHDLWSGEMVRVPEGRTARASFESMGVADLAGGAVVSFGTSRSMSQAGSRSLVANLLAGDLSLRLGDRTCAYIESCGVGFTASPGAAFKVRVRSGKPLVETVTGTVVSEPLSQQRTYKSSGFDARISVSARSTREVQIRITDENDNPVPDLPILFTLGNPCLGTLGIGAGAGTSFRQRTDNRGVAAVILTAGAARCIASLTANIEGTTFSWTQEVTVRGQSGFWSTRNTLLVAAAAATTATVIVTTNSDNRIEPVPPPVVRP